jgi:hypothetical protein
MGMSGATPRTWSGLEGSSHKGYKGERPYLLGIFRVLMCYFALAARLT